jgi:hypothetical protein
VFALILGTRALRNTDVAGFTRRLTRALQDCRAGSDASLVSRTKRLTTAQTYFDEGSSRDWEPDRIPKRQNLDMTIHDVFLVAFRLSAPKKGRPDNDR